MSHAFRELGEDAAPVASRLKKIADDDAVRDVAAMALAELGPAASDDAPEPVDPLALIPQLKSPNRWDRFDALRRLARLGPSAAPALPELVEVLDSGTLDDRVLAAAALGWIGEDDAVPALAEAISPEHWEVSLEAVRALAHYLLRTPLRRGGGGERDRESLLVGSLCSAVPTEVVRGGKKLAVDGGHGDVMPELSELLRDGAALGLVQVRDKLYAIMGSLHADVFGLERRGSQWILRHVVQLPGYPTRGTVVLMPDGTLTSDPCPCSAGWIVPPSVSDAQTRRSDGQQAGRVTLMGPPGAPWGDVFDRRARIGVFLAPVLLSA